MVTGDPRWSYTMVQVDGGTGTGTHEPDPYIRVYASRVHNLRDVDVAVPRDASWRSPACPARASPRWRSAPSTPRPSAATSSRSRRTPGGCCSRPARRRSTRSPGLPPAVALQQRRGGAELALDRRHGHDAVQLAAHAVLPRRHATRAGDRATGLGLRSRRTRRSARARSATGLGRIHRVTEATLVPDPSLSIREGAVAAWPGAWQGKNLRDILIALGYRRRQAMAQTAQARPRLDPLHRRAAHGRRSTPSEHPTTPTTLQRHVLERRAPRPAHAGQLAERRPCAQRALRFVRERRLPGLRRHRPATRGAGGDVRRPHHRRARRRCR